MLSRFRRTKKARRTYCKEESIRRLVKSLVVNEYLSPEARIAFKNLLKKKGNSNVVGSFCIKSGRRKGVVSEHRLSRIVFKEFANSRKLLGVKKSSW